MEGICEKIDDHLLREICELAMDQRETVCKIFIIGSGGVLSWLLFPFVLAYIGFTSTGIAAGSLAAKMMAYFAVANGGGVAAGSLVAFLQSIAAGGLSWGGTGAMTGAGATLASLLSTICNQTKTN